MGPWVKGLHATGTLFPWIWSHKDTKMSLVRLYFSLPKLLRPKGGFLFYGNLRPVLFVHPFMGHWVQWLLSSWTLLPWIWMHKNTKMGQVRLYGSLPKLPHPKGGFPFYGSLGSVLFIRPFVGPWVQRLLISRTLFPWIWSHKNTKWVKIDCMAAYQNCCVLRADFHFMEA